MTSMPFRSSNTALHQLTAPTYSTSYILMAFNHLTHTYRVVALFPALSCANFLAAPPTRPKTFTPLHAVFLLTAVRVCFSSRSNSSSDASLVRDSFSLSSSPIKVPSARPSRSCKTCCLSVVRQPCSAMALTDTLSPCVWFNIKYQVDPVPSPSLFWFIRTFVPVNRSPKTCSPPTPFWLAPFFSRSIFPYEHHHALHTRCRRTDLGGPCRSGSRRKRGLWPARWASRSWSSGSWRSWSASWSWWPRWARLSWSSSGSRWTWSPRSSWSWRSRSSRWRLGPQWACHHAL